MKNNTKDITGNTYNYLTAIERLPSYIKGKRRITLWKFKCICGNETIKESSDVKRGAIKSCGCKTKELMSNAKLIKPGEAALHGLYLGYKKNCAKDRGLEFSLTKEEFRKLTKGNCYYCNKEPSQVKKSKVFQYVYNGVDRVDNSKGYIQSNVVSCCGDCNALKSGISKEMVFKLYEWFTNNA